MISAIVIFVLLVLLASTLFFKHFALDCCLYEDCSFVMKPTDQISFVSSNRIKDSDKSARSTSCEKEAESTLKQIHVIFRHGDRTPDFLYPQDPHINNTFPPYGLKELTNAGKVREYNVGRELRFAYDSLLGQYYCPQTIESRSSYYNRTKASLQLVLAGLYPPKADQVWNVDLPWQPIPTNYIPASEDYVFLGIMNCANFKTLLKEVMNLPELVPTKIQFSSIYEYLNKHSGLNIETPMAAYELYGTLRTESEFGLSLPEWTSCVYPRALEEMGKKFFELFTWTDHLKKVAMGGMITTIWQNMLSLISGENQYKVQLYSGHDVNVGGLLRLLNVFYPHIPEYGSYVVLELHEIESDHFVRVKYQDNHGGAPKVMLPPTCTEFFPLEDFKELVEKYFIDWNSPCSP